MPHHKGNDFTLIVARPQTQTLLIRLQDFGQSQGTASTNNYQPTIKPLAAEQPRAWWADVL